MNAQPCVAVQEITFKFQTSPCNKSLFESSTCGGARTSIDISQAYPKSDLLILNIYYFLMRVLIVHKTGIVDQNTQV